MKNLKHTPGPWEYYKEEQRIEKLDMTLHFETVRLKENDTRENVVRLHNEHDARLIAAAPEMLEALIENFKVLFNKWDYGVMDSEEDQERLNGMQAVIEKATGLSIEEVLN